MDKEKIRVLLVDDDEDDFIMTRDLLDDVREREYEIEWVPRYDDAAAIIRAIIAMARSLKLRVIAEGVETRAQLELMKESGCDEIQGYLLSRPVPAADVIPLVRWIKSGAYLHEEIKN